jgi:hypothetical protein
LGQVGNLKHHCGGAGILGRNMRTNSGRRGLTSGG